ncbi:hypothetical protein Syn7502_00580 [Synechococcus sp. PCC 7502]|uniref:class I SAM-dependent methyltransferase n=1 Tax=Synechococcus sp. PCC 7502 TaxID=1173263 RepID=UPI00029FE462|nr:methyltransferase domain-containing protein [Synechococcus sp. PCC 7502]AFY72730.1 hypothetical protein Syn7502_00580 [Synechococcus sp. PCC 7502]
MKLNIGGTTAHPDWKIFDVEDRPEVDFIGNARDLGIFEDQSIESIYASHVLEHFYYGLDDELIFTLAEWHRVLKIGGELMISVPDIQILCWLYSQPKLDVRNRFNIMRMMFGGQVNEYDVHKVGFDFDTLAMYLNEVGFTGYKRVSEFNLFNDCSTISYLGYSISLNVIATK